MSGCGGLRWGVEMLYNTGTLVVESGTQTGLSTDTFAKMKQCAARVVGGENQTYFLDLAGAGILKGIDVVNMKHAFRFGSQQGSSTALVAGTKTYAVPSDTFAVHAPQLIDSAGDVYRTLEYIPWGQFNKLEQEQDRDGTPEWYTARNGFTDQVITVYPTPDSGSTVYSIQITSFERISRPVLDADVIAAPRELSEVLCTYAEYYILRTRNQDNPSIWLERKRAFDERLADFVNSTEREPIETLQWTLAPLDQFPREYDPLS